MLNIISIVLVVIVLPKMSRKPLYRLQTLPQGMGTSSTIENPILLTFIFMQSGYQAEIPQLSYVTYMDKLYFLAYLLAILDLADAIVFVSPKNRIDKLCKKYLNLDFPKH